MSVYIKDIIMPENCRVCRFYNSPTNTDYRMYAWCNVDGKTRDAYAMQDCPLIPVLPHGRLIDADAVERNLVKMQMAQKGVVGHGIRKSRAVVRDMATVIPADESIWIALSVFLKKMTKRMEWTVSFEFLKTNRWKKI